MSCIEELEHQPRRINEKQHCLPRGLLPERTNRAPPRGQSHTCSTCESDLLQAA